MLSEMDATKVLGLKACQPRASWVLFKISVTVTHGGRSITTTLAITIALKNVRQVSSISNHSQAARPLNAADTGLNTPVQCSFQFATAPAMDFKCNTDENNKATELPLLRLGGTVQQNPHMRAFWASTISFFLAFLGC